METLREIRAPTGGKNLAVKALNLVFFSKDTFSKFQWDLESINIYEQKPVDSDIHIYFKSS
jgi:hypothetical protein